jgi:hypothetical protein
MLHKYSIINRVQNQESWRTIGGQHDKNWERHLIAHVHNIKQTIQICIGGKLEVNREQIAGAGKLE